MLATLLLAALPIPARAAIDPHWSDLFATPGLDGPVYCATPFRGGIAVGGRFSFVAGIPARNVAWWDGAQWQALGAGTDGIVTSLLQFGNDLVVTGTFTHAGDTPANGAALYRDGSWQAMGAGLDAPYQLGPTGASALVVFRGDLYAAGGFERSGGTPLHYVARWDGTAWLDVGGGVDTESAMSMVVIGDRLYVGGGFAHAGGVPANGVARWDGSEWSALDSGVRRNGQAAQLLAMTAFDGGLAVGGDFDSAGTVAARNVAVWKESAWSALGEGHEGEVRAMTSVANGLLIGPNFEGPSRLWTGSAWIDPTPSGPNGIAYGYVNAGDLVVYGDVNANSGTSSPTSTSLLRAQGETWRGFESFNPRTNGLPPLYRIVALARDPHGILAGGVFHSIGSPEGWLPIETLARWDGTRWRNLPPIPFFGSIGAIAVHGDTIDVGGTFYEFGHDPWWIRPVLRLVGSTWTALDTLSLSVDAIRMYRGSLVIGGARNGTDAPDIGGAYRWNGTRWISLGNFTDHGRFKRVHTMEELDGQLVVGGAFDAIDGVAANSIAAWDGASWMPLGDGPGREDDLNAVYSLAIYRDQLVAAGQFGNPGFGIQSWDRKTWSPVGGFVGFGSALTVAGDELIAAADHVIAWNGMAWRELGDARGMVNEMLADEGGVYFGGSFTELGGQPAVGFGRWTRDDTPPATTTLSSGWPNPFRATITFQYQARVPGFLHLHVRDIRGRRVTTVERTALSAGIGQISWDGRDDAGQSVPAGIYFVTLVAADGARDSRKVVLLH